MIFLAGSTGFIGRHVAQTLRERGFEVRCLLRPDSDKDPAQRQRERERLASAGFQTVAGDVNNNDDLALLMEGCSGVVNLVGAVAQTRRQKFQQSHVESTGRLLEAASMAGVKRFIQMSALGASPDSLSQYHRSKWESEELVRASDLDWTVLRASAVVGAGDVFTNMIIDLLEKPLVAPVPCDGETQLQPVAVTDVARCIGEVISKPPKPRQIMNIAGPKAMRFSEMVDAVAQIYGSQGRTVRVPPGVVRPWAFVLQSLRSKRSMTLDQLRIITTDSVCKYSEVRAHFAWEFTSFEAAARDAIAARVATLAQAEAVAGG